MKKVVHKGSNPKSSFHLKACDGYPVTKDFIAKDDSEVTCKLCLAKMRREKK